MSKVLETLPRPDWASSTIVAVPAGLAADAPAWARAIFDVRSMPVWVKALFALREGFARLLRIPPGDPRMLAVDRVVGDEALIDTDDVHLRFAVGVRTDPGFVHVTTAVVLKGWRGRLYFAPVRLLHDTVTRSMVSRAATRLAAPSGLPSAP